MQRGLLKSYSATISVLTRVLDVLLIVFGGLLAHVFRFGMGQSIPVTYGALVLIGALLVAVLFPMLGVYRSWRAQGLLAPAGLVLFGWCLVLLVLFVLLVLGKEAEAFSRLWLGTWAVLTAVLLVGLRTAVYGVLRTLRSRGYNRRSVVMVGDGPVACDLIRQARDAVWAGFEVAAVFVAAGEKREVERIPARPLDELAAFVEASQVDEVWIAMPLTQSERLRELLEQLRTSAANVRYVPDLFGLFLLNHGMTDILGMPMIDLSASPMQGVNRMVKGLEDRLLSALILLLISPLMILIAIGVKLSSPGPVFYRQERLGWNGRPFMMFKFRSMPVDAESATGAVWAKQGESRATAFGTFLRRTSLDELPQFINVLKGDMSIVGPRPERPMFVEQFKNEIPGYMQKHMVKAGITGWAQVNGWRGDTDLKKRIEHDLYYIENWSLSFDLKIIFLTLFRGFVHKNAY